jgi:hypothetical protein
MATEIPPPSYNGSGQVADSATSVAPATSTPTKPATKQLGGGVDCAAPPQVSAGDTLTLRATATVSGKPVNVSVYAGAGEHVVVIEDSDCKLLNLQMMG